MSLLTGKTIVKAEDLRGPRVYSTDLLPSLLTANDIRGGVETAARALKVKMITKGVVTLNSVFLVSPLTVHLLEKHPDLFSGPALVPAFREDHTSWDQLVSAVGQSDVKIDPARLEDHIAKVSEAVRFVMPWELKDTGQQYKSAVIDGLRKEGSLVRDRLAKSGVDVSTIDTITAKIDGLKFDRSAELRDYIATLDQPIRGLIQAFAAGCYHMVGAGVVRCETGIDLSPLSSLKAADLLLANDERRPQALSDEALFLEAFMVSALDTVSAGALPAQIIDSLDFGTVHNISEALRRSGFQEKYDDVVSGYLSKAAWAGMGAQKILEAGEVERIAQVAKELAEEFHREVIKEAPNHVPAAQAEARDVLMTWATDTTKEAVGAVPVLGNILAVAEVVGKVADGVEAAGNVVPAASRKAALEKARQDRIDQIRSLVARIRVSEGRRSSLLDATNMLSDIYTASVRRA